MGEAPVVAGDGLAGDAVEVGGAAVVAEALPGLPHPAGRGVGEVVHRWVPFEEARIVFGDPSDLGLLEHELGHQHVVGIAGGAPGQRAPRVAEPPQDETLEAERVGGDAHWCS